MKRFISFQYFLIIIVICADGRDPAIDEPMKELVERFDYPFEVHEVVTEDDYLLGVYRIPNNDTENNDLPPVLMMHGLLGAAPDWVVTGPNRSLAFLLSDNGFDVWMGNNRGTTYSKEHRNMSSDHSKYWDFSWHELGMYDTPAIIDYILKKTNRRKLLYVCFSQGCTQFFVMASMKPEYNDKVILMSGLAPAAFTTHMEGIVKVVSPWVQMGRFASEWAGYMEVMPHTTFLTTITDYTCSNTSRIQYLCELMIFFVGGFSEDRAVDKEHLAEYLRYSPAGCSNKQLLHYGMGICSGHFRQYDYGMFKNLRLYHSLYPPDYNLSNVITPVFIYNGLNDYLASLFDVAELASKLPNVINMHTVKLEKLNHFDFLYGVDIKQLAYEPLLDDLMSYILEKNDNSTESPKLKKSRD